MVKDDIPKFLQEPPTPERLAENAKNQRKFRAMNAPFAPRAPQQMFKERGAIKEQELKPIIEEMERVGDTDALSKLYPQMAEALHTQGRHLEAASFEPNMHKRAEMMRAHIADSVSDDSWCEHPFDVPFVFRKRNTENAQRPILECSVCGFSNARTPPRSLLDAEAHRAKVRELTKGRSPEEAAALINAQGLNPA